jgi:hypothetical protein
MSLLILQQTSNSDSLKKDSAIAGNPDSVSLTPADSGKNSLPKTSRKNIDSGETIQAQPVEAIVEEVIDSVQVATKSEPDSLTENTSNFSDRLIFTPFPFEKKELRESLFNTHLLQAGSLRPEIHPYGKPWVSFVLLSVFALVSFTKYFSSKKLALLFSTLTDHRGVVQIASDENELPLFLRLNLTLIYFVISSLFIIQLISFYGIKPETTLKTPLMFLLIGSFMGFYLLKAILLRLVALVFDARKQIAEHIAINSSFSSLTGLMLFPVVALLQYAPSAYQKILINTGIILILVFWTYRIIRILISGWVLPGISKAHLFIYLCTLEILPVLILYRIIKLTFDI